MLLPLIALLLGVAPSSMPDPPHPLPPVMTKAQSEAQVAATRRQLAPWHACNEKCLKAGAVHSKKWQACMKPCMCKCETSEYKKKHCRPVKVERK